MNESQSDLFFDNREEKKKGTSFLPSFLELWNNIYLDGIWSHHLGPSNSGYNSTRKFEISSFIFPNKELTISSFQILAFFQIPAQFTQSKHTINLFFNLKLWAFKFIWAIHIRQNYGAVVNKSLCDGNQ